MPGKNSLKFINSLKQKKFRLQHRLFIMEGEKMVDELFESRFSVHSVYATARWIDERPWLKSRLLPVHEIREADLARISSLSTPNRVLALVHFPSGELSPDELVNSHTLVLDNIQDPGNLGTLIRTCDWFGIKNIICSENSVEATNPKVVQSTMGSLLRVNVHYLRLPALMQLPEIKNIPVFGAFAEGPDIYGQQLPAEALIVLGNESRGISAEVEKYITGRISIPCRWQKEQGSHEREVKGRLVRSGPAKEESPIEPRPKERPPESLNIAVAGSIIISEFKRRQG